jgi:hypothetical protein
MPFSVQSRAFHEGNHSWTQKNSSGLPDFRTSQLLSFLLFLFSRREEDVVQN